MDKIEGFGLSVNCVLFKFDENQLKTLILKRNEEPHIGTWSLPGNLVKTDEELQQAAYRTIDGHTAYRPNYIMQASTYSAIDRHPQGRVASVAFLGIIQAGKHQLRENPKVFSKLEWTAIQSVPKLSFDHNDILKTSVKQLFNLAKNPFFLVHFLGEKFKILDFYEVFTFFNQQKMDKANFRRKMLSYGVFTPIEEFEEGTAHRPAQFYVVNKEKLQSLLDEDTVFSS